MTHTYPELLHTLFALQTQSSGKEMTLDNTLRLNEAFGRPDRHYPIIHVGGSNGKGSVVTKIARSLQLSGLRVGTYTSPHLSCFRERIQVNGTMISEEDILELAAYGQKIYGATGITPSFFELTTAIAFRYFSDAKVDVAVVEVGLGGRLDATNIVTPIISVITSISLEHTHILGHTIEAIAKEKGGIIKERIPLVVGPKANVPILRTIAQERSSLYHAVADNFAFYDAENSAIAAKTLQLIADTFPCSSDHISAGTTVRPPCRMEEFTIGNGVILDVAHNPDAFAELLKSLRARYPDCKLRFVCGFSKDKNVIPSLSLLKGHPLHLVAADHSRAMPLQMLAAEAERTLLDSPYTLHPNVADGITAALEAAQQEFVVVCGSFFLMREARQALGIPQISDPVDLNEQRLPIAKKM